jgi:hypothetical protein
MKNQRPMESWIVDKEECSTSKNAKNNHNILLIDLHNSLEMKARKRLTKAGVSMILDCEVVRSQVIYVKLEPF